MLAGTLAALVLIALTFFALSGNGSDATGAASPSTSHSSTVSATGGSTGGAGAAGPSVSITPTTSPSAPLSSAPVLASGGASVGASTSTSAAAVGCLTTQLAIKAAAKAPKYKIGQQPVLILQVTNKGPGNCVQDLADSQIELRVYNGAARVWGSHDCQIVPGTAVQTLVAGSTVGVQETWSGLSSQPGCAGTRQRVGAGTYTVYALLSGTQGTPGQFSITA